MTRVALYQSLGLLISKKFTYFMKSPFLLGTSCVTTTHLPSDSTTSEYHFITKLLSGTSTRFSKGDFITTKLH